MKVVLGNSFDCGSEHDNSLISSSSTTSNFTNSNNVGNSTGSRFQTAFSVLSNAAFLSNNNHSPELEIREGSVAYQKAEMLRQEEIKMKELWHSIPYFTYRLNFSAIPGTALTTDVGWGCLHRSGQMMLAVALFRCLGIWESDRYCKAKREVLAEFLDNNDVALSIHKICLTGTLYGKAPGEWFSPTVLANVMKLLIEPVFSKIKVILANNTAVNKSAVEESLSAGNCVILLVPQRFGLDNVNPLYFSTIKVRRTILHCCFLINYFLF